MNGLQQTIEIPTFAPAIDSGSVLEVGPARRDEASLLTAIHLLGRIGSQVCLELGLYESVIQEELCGAYGEKVANHIEAMDELISTSGENHQVLAGRIDGVTAALVIPRVEGSQQWITKLYMAPHLQGKGHGAMMLEGAVDALDEGQPIHLKHASYNERAHRFYQKHGFIFTRHLVSDYDFGGVRVPQHEMIRPPYANAHLLN